MMDVAVSVQDLWEREKMRTRGKRFLQLLEFAIAMSNLDDGRSMW